MRQELGRINIAGTNHNYAERLSKISDNSMFNITRAYYRVYLFGMRDRDGDTAEGYFNIGRVSGRYWKRFRENDQEYAINIPQQANEVYQSGGIANLIPLDFPTTWSRDKAIEFSIEATTKTAPTVSFGVIKFKSHQSSIEVNWNSTMQESFLLRVSSNTVSRVYSGRNKKSFKIPANTFGVAEKVKITLEIRYTHKNQLNYYAYAIEETSINLVDTTASISEFLFKNNVFTWKGKNIDECTGAIQIINETLNNALVHSISLTQDMVREKQVRIPSNVIFYNGNHKATITIGKLEVETYEELLLGDSKSLNFQIENKPYIKINSLEPSGVSRNYEKAIKIDWDVTNQQSYSISVLQDETTKFTNSGLTEKTVTIPANTLKSGTAIINLVVTNNVYGIIKSDTKQVNFELYGSINAPVISVTGFENGRNNLDYLEVSWNKSNQQKYFKVQFDILRKASNAKVNTRKRLDTGIILDEDRIIKVDSGLIRGNENKYKSSEFIFNGDIVKNIRVTVYTGIKEGITGYFERDISFYSDFILNNSSRTSLSCNVENDNLIISFGNTPIDCSLYLYRKAINSDKFKLLYETFGKTLFYKDKRVKHDIKYLYYVVAVFKTLGANSGTKSAISNVAGGNVNFKGYIFETDDYTKNFNLEIACNFEYIDGKKEVIYLGKSCPDILYDDVAYQIGSFSCLVNKNELSEIDKLFKAKEVFYKDSKGNGFICSLSNKNIAYEKLDDYVKLSFKITEIDNKKVFE